jgi:hypothetical protein
MGANFLSNLAFSGILRVLSTIIPGIILHVSMELCAKKEQLTPSAINSPKRAFAT